MNKFVFDTYAILEIISGNKDYEKYLEAYVIINPFIFAELCFKLQRDKIPNAKKITDDYKENIIQVDAQTIYEAMSFRAKHMKRKLSATDCISYIMAQNLGIRFLTGDKEFESMANVEYVK